MTERREAHRTCFSCKSLTGGTRIASVCFRFYGFLDQIAVTIAVSPSFLFGESVFFYRLRTLLNARDQCFIETRFSNPSEKDSATFPLLDFGLLTLFPVCRLITCNAHCDTVTEDEEKPKKKSCTAGWETAWAVIYITALLRRKKMTNPGYFTVDAGVFIHLWLNSWILFPLECA